MRPFAREKISQVTEIQENESNLWLTWQIKLLPKDKSCCGSFFLDDEYNKKYFVKGGMLTQTEKLPIGYSE